MLAKFSFIREAIRQVSPILLCIGWAAMGGGAGLINTITHGEKENIKNNSSTGQKPSGKRTTSRQKEGRGYEGDKGRGFETTRIY
jgi:hypothetical protein